MNALRLTEIDILPVKPCRGLIGFVSFVINNAYYLGNIAIHTTLDGGIRLVYPEKVLANGKRMSLFYPISKEVGELITAEVLRVYRELLKEVREEVTNK